MCDVPALRFPEFIKSWECSILEKLSKKIGDGIHSTPSYDDNGTFYFINGNNLNGGKIVITSSTKRVSEKEAYKNNAENLEANSILMSINGTIGNVALYHNEPIMLGKSACYINSKDNIDKNYLFYYLQYPKTQLYFEAELTGTTIKNLSLQSIRKTKIYIPTIEEQHKISRFLQKIDERISTQNKIIEDLRLLRDAIMVEHYRKCNKSKLCIYDIGEPFNVMNLSKDDLTKDGSPCIIYGELFTTYGCVIENVVSHTTKSPNSTLSTKGDLLFPASTTVDALSLIAPSSINEDGIILGGDMFGIHVNEQYNSNYLSYYFNIIGKKNLAKYAKGSTIIHLHYADIQKAKITLPNKNEQEAVANLLLKVEHKLNIEQKMLINYLNTKNFLLWQMFI